MKSKEIVSNVYLIYKDSKTTLRNPIWPLAMWDRHLDNLFPVPASIQQLPPFIPKDTLLNKDNISNPLGGNIVHPNPPHRRD